MTADPGSTAPSARALAWDGVRIRWIGWSGVVLGSGALFCGGLAMVGSLASPEATTDSSRLIAQIGALASVVCGFLLGGGSALLLRGRQRAGVLVLRGWAVLRLAVGTFTLVSLGGVSSTSAGLAGGLQMVGGWELVMMVYTMVWLGAIRGG